ncbi:leucine-rich repeat-containing protein 47-like [Chironomus tepperi]|uniref:leucine-rich repeat-containing protein 47-like n=1 Tax=Chironomus tepperi TaxID=113505 RepID=UPI00391F434F
MWEIVKLAKSENKREISINGQQLTELLEENNGNIDVNLFKLNQLNLLRLSNSPVLCEINGKLNDLSQLQSLLLFGNKLKVFPEIDQLLNLKNLDLSKNCLTSVDVDFTSLTQLTTVNLSDNEISAFNMKSSSIHILNLSVNKLEKFPENLPTSLTELNLSKNEITDIPEDIKLTNLKFFDASENKITAVPKSLAAIKMKTLNLKQNSLKDRKLFKLIDQNQSLKAIMDHIQKLGISSEESAKSNQKSKQNKSESNPEQREIVIKKYDEDFKIEYDQSVKDVRGFILCCLVRNLQFNASTLKDFLQFQTKLHDTTCKKRELATIATHDFKLIPSKHLKYAAKCKDEIKIQPLNRGEKLYSGSEYFEALKNEAEAFRKEKKRSQVTGVYKFLQLLEDKTDFAFLETDSHICLSLPPLTNSENSKMSVNTTQLLIEVTSHHNAAICSKIMQELITKLNELNHAIGNNTLELQQVRIVGNDGILKTLYPSKIDLKDLESDLLKIIRP